MGDVVENPLSKAPPPQKAKPKAESTSTGSTDKLTPDEFMQKIAKIQLKQAERIGHLEAVLSSQISKVDVLFEQINTLGNRHNYLANLLWLVFKTLEKKGVITWKDFRAMVKEITGEDLPTDFNESSNGMIGVPTDEKEPEEPEPAPLTLTKEDVSKRLDELLKD